MKLLHTADWHLGKSLYEFSLLEDQRALLESIPPLLEREGVDAVVIAGDLYDRPVPPAGAVRLFDSFLAKVAGEMKIPVLAIAGNHDSPSRLEFGGSLTASSGYHISGQARRELSRVTLRDEFGPVDFWLLPFLHPAEARALFPEETVRTYDDAYRVIVEGNLHRLDRERRNVVVAHGFFSAVGGGKTILTSESEVNIGGMDLADSGCFDCFDYAALGHLHAPQRAGRDTVRYAGSPLKYSLSEETQRKCFTLVHLGPKGDIRLTEQSIAPLRDVRTVRGELDELLEPCFHENKGFGDYVFAYLSDADALYPMEKLRKLFPRLLGLQLLGEGDGAMPEIRLGGGMPKASPEEMFRRFYREVRGHDMPQESLDLLREAVADLEEGRGEEE